MARRKVTSLWWRPQQQTLTNLLAESHLDPRGFKEEIQEGQPKHAFDDLIRAGDGRAHRPLGETLGRVSGAGPPESAPKTSSY